MNDELRARLAQQVEERITVEQSDLEARVVKQFRDRGNHKRADETAANYLKVKAEMVAAQIARTLPFALTIAERDGVADRLSEDQFHEAELKATRLNLREVMQSFGARFKRTPSISPQKREFA